MSPKLKCILMTVVIATSLYGAACTSAFAADTLAPTIDNKNPTENALSVPTNSVISFDVWDTESGVSVDTLILKVNGVNVSSSTSHSGDTASYNFTYDPASDLNYGAFVTVDISIQDVSGNTQTSVYTFTTLADNTAPTFNTFRPSVYAVNVPTNSSITFAIQDSETGITMASLIVTVNNVNVTSQLVSAGTLYARMVTYDPATDFDHGSVVSVELFVKDVSGNAQNYSYSFTTHADTTSPTFNTFRPSVDAMNVPTNSSITFAIQDSETGINMASLIVTVNNVNVTAALVSAGTLYTHMVTYDPAVDFDLGQLVNVSLEVKDVSGNIATQGYSFTTHQDLTAPVISGRTPNPGSTLQPTNSIVAFTLTDSEGGISINTLQVTINAHGMAKSMVITSSNSSLHTYQVTCDTLVDFDYYDHVTVDISIRDVSGNRQTDTYTFSVIFFDTTAPSVSGKYPAMGSTEVPTTSLLAFQLDDQETGVNIASLKVTINVNGSAVPFTMTSTNISPTQYAVTCDPTSDLPFGAWVTMNIMVQDISGNIRTDLLTFQIHQDITAPLIQNRHPTPNDRLVPTNDVLSFKLSDMETGINIDSLQITLNINDAPVAYTLSTSNNTIHYYFVTCAPVAGFAHSDRVTVNIAIQDVSGNTALDSYSFRAIYFDTTAPTISFTAPSPNNSDAPTNTMIVLYLGDEEIGVSIDTLQITLNVNGATASFTTTAGNINGGDYIVTCDPNIDFDYADLVSINVSIKDVSGNSREEEYSFAVHMDTTAPVITDVTALTDIPTNSMLVVRITDPETGISKNTLRVTVNLNGGVIPFTMSTSNGTLYSMIVTCDPTSDFYYGDSVSIDVQVLDISGNIRNEVHTFAVHQDTTAPAVSDRSPIPNSMDLPTSSVITFSLTDTETGISINTLRVTINANGNAVPYSLTSANSTIYRYTVTCDPVADLYYGDTVTVDLQVRDISGNIKTDTFTFVVHQDTTVPAISNRLPIPSSSDLPTNSMISFQIDDTETGVSISSLQVTINARGSVAPYTLTSANSTIYRYTVTCDPVTDLYYGDTVTVDLQVRDISGNIKTDTFTFVVHQDTTAPLISSMLPTPNGADIPTNDAISFVLSDTETGVSISALLVTINVNNVTQSYTLLTSNGTIHIFHVTCDPTADFPYGAWVTINVLIVDVSGNLSTTSYTFSTNEVPQIFPYDPTANDIIVPVKTDIVFTITDNAVVVTSSLQVSLNNSAVIKNGISADPASYTIGYRAITSGYRVSIDPIAVLPYDTTMSVDILIADEQGETTVLSYAFHTDMPPVILPIYPTPDAPVVPVETDLVFDITDNVHVVTGSLVVTVNGTRWINNGAPVNVVSYNISYTAILGGYRVSIDPLLPFDYGSLNTLSIYVTDQQDHPTTRSYSFTTKPALQIYVATTGNNFLGDGTVNKPYQTPQKGLNIVTHNGTVYLFPGTYPLNTSGNIQWPNKSNVTLTGYLGGGATSSNVILDGQNATRDIYVNHAVNTTIRDLTVRNGQLSGIDGAGIYIGTTAHLDLINVIITANTARNGAGIYANGGTISANTVLFSGNTAAINGGAAYQGTWTVINGVFVNNYASIGSVARTGTWVLRNCILRDNHADTGGIGYTGTWHVENSTIYNNYADTQAGILYGGSWTAVNTIMWNNKENSVEKNQFVDSSLTLNYSLVSTMNYRSGAGTTTTLNLVIGDPIFVSESDLRLGLYSPAIEAGTSAVAVTNDINGLPRGILSQYDIGAYEYDGLYIYQMDPTPNETGVSFNSTITCKVERYNGIVSITSINIMVDGIQYQAFQAPSFGFTGTAVPTSNWYIVVTPIQPFTFNKDIPVTISAEDSRGTTAQITYSFRTISDTNPPTIDPILPTSNAVHIPLEAPIVIDLIDDYAGIVTSSLWVSVNGQLVIAGGETNDTINYSISMNAIANGYRLTIDPLATFIHDTMITVDIRVTDRNPNQTTYSYTFQTASANVHNYTYSPTRHYTRIQGALNDAGPYHTLTVEPGEYFENIIWTATPGVALSGTATSDLWQTRINGNLSGRVFTFSSPVTATIQGLMILRGQSSDGGGGIGLMSSGITLNIIDCIVSGNTAVYGGGIYQADGTAVNVINSIIKKNSATLGGGMYCTGNVQDHFMNSIFHANQTITFAGGGAIYGGKQDIVNTILWGNMGGVAEDQIENISGTVSYTIVQNAQYSGQSWDKGNNLSTDPLFRDTLNNDYRLLPGSPAIESGTSTFDQTVIGQAALYDLAGIQRPLMNYYDRGAYEFDSIFVRDLIPSSDATNIPVGQIVSLTLVDVGHSIVSTSITVNVNGTNYRATGTNTFNISGQSTPTASLVITISPTSNWPPNSDIWVQLTALNVSGDMLGKLYKFTTAQLYMYNDNYSPRRYYTTIQNALNDAGAGHTIWLDTNTFSEPVTWNNSIASNVTLRGANIATASVISGGPFLIDTGAANINGVLFSTPLLINNATVTIDATIVSGCVTAGIQITNSSVTISRSFIKKNTKGINKISGTLMLENSVINNNTNEGLINTADQIYVRHSTIYGNGIGISNSGAAVIWNSILWNNTIATGGATLVNFSYSDVQGGASGAGNINSDPLFTAVAAEDFRVSKNSLVLEAGTSINIPAFDYTGTQNRSSGRAPDMGIYERPEVRLPADRSYYYTDSIGSTANITENTTIFIKRTQNGSDIGSIKIVPTELGINIFTFDLSDIVITRNSAGLPLVSIIATGPLGTTVNNAFPVVYIPLTLQHTSFATRRPLLTLDTGFGPYTITRYNGTTRSIVPSSDYQDRVFNYTHISTQNTVQFRANKFSSYGSTLISSVNFDTTSATGDALSIVTINCTVYDSLGQSVEGAPVYFTLISGTGSLLTTLSYTNATGNTYTRYQLPLGNSFSVIRASSDGVISAADCNITGNALVYLAHNDTLSRNYLTLVSAFSDPDLDNGHILSVDAGKHIINISWPNKQNLTVRGTSSAAQVILDGNGNNSVVQITNAVSLNLQNLTLQNGNTAGQGGALSGSLSGITVTMRDCIVSGNQKSAVYFGGTGTFIRVTFNNNTSSGGGGAVTVLSSAKVDVKNCTFLNNQAGTNGGGLLANNGAMVTVNGSSFIGNSAAQGGAGASLGDIIIRNCVFASNNASTSGGAWRNDGSNTVISHSTFVKNTAGTGAALNANTAPQIINSIFWHNNTSHGINGAVTVTYSDLQNWSLGGTGNITTDPLFTSEANNDLHLIPTSNALDRGLVISGITTDLDSNPRVQGYGPDMGAYEAATRDPVLNITTGTLYSTITSALASANSGEVLEVRPGVYYENITWPSVPGITLKGDCFTTSANCIIDGSLTNRVITVPNNISLTLQGLTIRNGAVSNPNRGGGISLGTNAFVSLNTVIVSQNIATAQSGGGIYGSSGSSVNAINCLFAGNISTISGSGGGGAMIVPQSILRGCTFIGNTAANSGGALYIGIHDISDCSFINNTAINGGALYQRASSTPEDLATINRTIFSGNTASSGQGGAIYGKNNVIINALFKQNSASSGGGIYSGTNTIQHCIFTSNNASVGSAIAESGSTIYNTIIWNNTGSLSPLSNPGTVRNCIVQGGWSGDGNIATTPNFIQESAGNYRLSIYSSGIEAGTRNINSLAQTDTDLRARPLYGQPDIGMYEYHGLYVIEHMPTKNSSDIAPTTAIGLRIVDLDTTVNINAITVNFQGINYTASGAATFNYTDLSSASTANIWITVTTSAGTLSKGKTYTVTIDVKDAQATTYQDLLTFTTIAPPVVYIAPTGNDLTGDGSLSSPFQTVQKGLDTVAAQGTVYVHTGRYIENIIWPNKNGILLTGSSPELWSGVVLQGTNTVIYDGYAVTGQITGLTIESGSTGININNPGSSLTLNQVCISGNTTTAIQNNGAISLVNTLLVRNTGNGLNNTGTASLEFVTIADNSNTGLTNSGTAQATSSIIWNNTTQINNSAALTLSNCVVQNGYAGTNIVTKDPIFAAAAAGNYAIVFGSGAIDMGVTSEVTTDITGHVRPQTDGYDCGAYEYQGPVIYDYFPTRNAIEISVTSAIVIKLKDALPALDIDSMRITINNSLYTTVSIGVTFSGTITDRTITINPSTALPPNSTITPLISIRDTSGNIMEETGYSFKTVAPLSIVYVSANAPSGGSGALNDPFNKIQDALSYLATNNVTGGVAVIMTGNYSENIIWPTKNLQLTIKGGSSASSASVVIDGSGTDRVIKVGASNDGTGLTLENLTIQNGSSTTFGGGMFCANNTSLTLNNVIVSRNRSSNSHGGGIYINGATTTLNITNCWFIGNRSQYNGGAIYKRYGTGVISNSVFEENTATGDTSASGGSIRNQDGKLSLTNCRFQNNRSNATGGAIYNDNDMSITSCRFFQNRSLNQTGGAIYHTYGLTVIVNTLFTGDQASLGGALYLNSGTSYINNNTFYNNTSTGAGGGAVYNNTASLYMRNNILWGNSAGSGSTTDAQVISFGSTDIQYTDVQGGYSGVTNLNVDPQFTSTIDNNLEPAVFNLTLESGTGVGSYIPTIDIIGRNRPLYGRQVSEGATAQYDMGAYEKTSDDLYAPIISQLRPAHGSTNNANNTAISCRISDTLSGISLNTLTMYVNGTLVSPIVSSNGIVALVTYNPSTTFNFSSTVYVTWNVQDVSGNSATATSSFSIIAENIPPVFGSFDPTPNTSGAALRPTISVVISDEHSGVSQNSIRLWVKGSEVSKNISGTTGNTLVQYRPSVNFNYGDTVTVSVYATDALGNAAATTYSFTVYGDTTGPSLSALVPTDGATGIIPTQPISVTISDTETGVSIASLQFVLNGVSITSSLTISGTPASYIVSYLTPAFGYLETEHLTINVQDIKGNTSILTASFQTKEDTIAPVITPTRPLAGAGNISHNASITVRIADTESGVSRNTISMMVNDLDVSASLNIAGTSALYTATLNTREYGYLQQVMVTVSARDIRNNLVTSTFSFTTEPDLIPPVVFNQLPIPYAAGAEQTASISFQIIDQETAVSTSSITISVSDEGIAVTGTLTITGSGPTYNGVFEHAALFGLMHEIRVTINAQDIIGNMGTTTYFFSTGIDSTPPHITAIDPTASASNVLARPTINIRFYDNETRIVSASIRVTANGQNVSGLLTISGGPVTYDAVYRPTQPYNYGQVVNIAAQVVDFGGNTTNYAYSFSIESDTYAPTAPTLYSLPVPLAPATTNIGIFTVTGAAEPYSYVRVLVNDTLANIGQTDATGLFSIPVTISMTGHVTINAVCLDSAANQSPTSNDLVILTMERSYQQGWSDPSSNFTVTASIMIPVGAVNFDAQARFSLQPSVSATAELLFVMPFELVLMNNGTTVSAADSHFDVPVIVTLDIAPTLDVPVDELSIFYLTAGGTWSTDGITIIRRSTTQIVFSTTHFSTFSVVRVLAQIIGGSRTPGIFVAPNPVDPDKEAIHFMFTKRDDTEGAIFIQVYDLSGQKIWENKESTLGRNGDLLWDGRDMWGETLSNGVYIAYIRMEEKGHRTIKRVKFAVLR